MALLPNQMLHPTFITGVVQAKPSKAAIKQNYRALDLLPWENVPERQVMWDVIYSTNNLAGIYAPDGEAIPGNDLLFSSMMTNIIDVKAARNLESWSVQQIRDPGMLNVYKAGGSSHTVTGIQQRLRNHINDRISDCNDRIDAQIEYIGMHSLQGSVVWPPKAQDGSAITNPMPHWNADMSVNVTFPLPAGQNQRVSTLTGYSGGITPTQVAWTTHATADPINNLSVINQYMLKTLGISMRGGRLIMSQVVLDHMAQCATVLDWLLGEDRSQPGAREYIDEDTLKSAIRTKTGYSIETYDAQWTYEERVPGTKPVVQRVDFLKEGKIIMLPPGWDGASMMTTLVENEAGQWAYGKMGWSYRHPKPPYPIELGINATCWPKFTSYDWFVLDVYN